MTMVAIMAMMDAVRLNLATNQRPRPERGERIALMHSAFRFDHVFAIMENVLIMYAPVLRS